MANPAGSSPAPRALASLCTLLLPQGHFMPDCLAMLLAMAVSWCLAADPSVAVLVGRRASVPAADAAKAIQPVVDSLAAAGVSVLSATDTKRRLARTQQKDATLCKGQSPCLQELARQLEVPSLVLISAARVGDDKSISLELFVAESGAVVESEAAVVDTWKSDASGLWGEFAQRVLKRLQPPEPPPEVSSPPIPTDAPVTSSLTLEPLPPPPPPPVVPPPPRAPRTHTVSWLAGGAGAVALVVAGVLLAVGLSNYNSLFVGPIVGGTILSELTEAEATKRVAESNSLFGASGAVGALGLVLGTTALLAW